MISYGLAGIAIAECFADVISNEPRVVITRNNSDDVGTKVEGRDFSHGGLLAVIFATTTAFASNRMAVTRRGWKTGTACANRRALRLPLRATIKLGPQTTKPHNCGSEVRLCRRKRYYRLPTLITLYGRDILYSNAHFILRKEKFSCRGWNESSDRVR